jgi:tetrahydromethanopterin S-methyltransferase subunit F
MLVEFGLCVALVIGFAVGFMAGGALEAAKWRKR